MKRLSFLCLAVAMSLLVSAEEVTTLFTALSSDGKYYMLDSVCVTNQTRGWSQTIDCCVDTSVTYSVESMSTDIDNIYVSSSENGAITNYRCYLSSHRFTINVKKAGMISIRAIDMLGRNIVSQEDYCNEGAYDYHVSLAQVNPFILSVTMPDRAAAMMLVNMSATGNNTIRQENVATICHAPLRQQEAFYLKEGDQMHYIGYSHRQGEVLISEEIFALQGLTNETICFIFEPASLSSEGVYVGLMGFNNNLYSYPIGLFSSSNLSAYNSFINARTTANGTILAHAVYNALDSLEMAPIPNKLADVALVIFTDGLENASWRRNSNFKNSDSYLQAVSDRIYRMWIDGTKLTSYSIGIKGSDVSDVERFERQLKNLASDSTCFYNVADMNEVKKKFRDIAAKICNSHASYSLSLSIPAQEPGDRIRLTFDNVNDAALSEYYIEGTYDFDFDNFYGILDNVVYSGVTCTNGTTLVSVPDEIFDIFTIDDLMTNLGERVNVSNIKQWYYIPSTGQWQVNSEFTPESGAVTTEERNSAIVMLVLDCSSSLGSDFASVQTNAKDFLKVLAGQTTFSKPVISTKSYPVLGNASAILGGVISNDGSLTIVDRGVCISKYSNMDSVRFYSSNAESTDFEVTVDELIGGEKYYYRAYARNNVGISYGTQRQFTAIEFHTPMVNTLNASANGYTTAIVSGEVTNDGNQEVTERGICYSTLQTPTIDDFKVSNGNGLGSYTCNITDLSAGTTYYVRAYATNSVGTAYGEELSFTTQAYPLPVVTTATIWTANYTSASAENCTVNTTEGATITERGVCFSTHENPTIEDGKVIQGSGTGSYSITISNLEEGTVYYVRAYAISVAGTGYGDEISFKTKGDVPTVSIWHIDTPDATSVSCTGNISSNGGVTLIERGFCYSLEPEPNIDDGHIVVSGTSTGSFSGTLTGLALNTTYYVRAYAVNKIGISYSEQQTFTTADGLATVTIRNATATLTTITINGEVTSDGGFPVAERGICYSAVNNIPTLTDNKVACGEGNDPFCTTLSNLSVSTTYYLRAYATNENGTNFGEVLSVTTKSGNVSLSMGSITDIKALSAVGTFTITNLDGATLDSCGLCWSTSPYPSLIGCSHAVSSSNTLNTNLLCTMSDLQPNTTYYVCAYAATNVSQKYSAVSSFTTPSGLPIVIKGTSSTTATSITISGNVTDNGGYTVSERGICYSTTNSNPTIADTKVIWGEGNGSFNATMTNLTPSTTYYVRTYATNIIGTGYSETATIITKNGAAVSTLGSFTNVGAYSARNTITVSNANGATLQSCGICWSTSENPTIADNTVIADGTSLNTAYTCEMTGLQENTTYYVRAFAITDIATTYSDQKTVSTLTASCPTVSLSSRTVSSASSVNCTGNVTFDGNMDIIECGFCWSTTSSPTITDNFISVTPGTGSFNGTLTGLSLNTTYYIRAYARNQKGISYSNQSSVYISKLTYSASSKLSETTGTTSAGLHTNAFGVSIGSHTFSGGTGTIAFDGNLTSIGNYAFYQCTGMTTLTIPSTVTTLGNYCFGGCTGLSSVTIPSSVTSLGDFCFAGCTSLSAITIPTSVTRIGQAAFGACRFTSITVPSSVASFGGGYTFINCTSLTTATLPDNLTVLPNGIFGGCSALTTVNMSPNLTSIGSEAFTGCTHLASITIPSTVATIGTNAFYNCSGLTSVTINSNSIVNNTYTYTSSLKDIFGTQVRQYTIGAGVTGIGAYAFYQCSNMRAVSIPYTVSSIGIYAFADCTGLTSITCRATNPPTCGGNRTTSVFNNVTKSIRVYVMSASVSKYKSALGWSDFTNYIGIN